MLQGVYVYDQTTKQGRLLIDIVDMSHTVSDSVQQIIRAPSPANNQILWQKVSEGSLATLQHNKNINDYNTNITIQYDLDLD